MSQNNLENQLTKTDEEGLLIKLFSIIIGHKRLQAPAKSHPTSMTRLHKKDDWIQKRLHRKAARYLERAASSSSSPERENMDLTISSVLLCGVLRKEKIEFFLSSTHLHSCGLQIRDHNQMSQILAAYGERASSEVAKRLRARTAPPGYD
jgi:hypothetical protein